MPSRLAFAGCLLLTLIVGHTCVRIEVLNARCGYYLPRTDFGDGNRKWRVAPRRAVLMSLDRRIALERLETFAAAHPDAPVAGPERFVGPPYSDAEQALIDAGLAENALRAELRSWVGGMGLLQYALAPLALVWAAALIYRGRSFFMRLASSGLAVCAIVAIGLMLYRGYLTSLGW